MYIIFTHYLNWPAQGGRPPLPSPNFVSGPWSSLALALAILPVEPDLRARCVVTLDGNPVAYLAENGLWRASVLYYREGFRTRLEAESTLGWLADVDGFIDGRVVPPSPWASTDWRVSAEFEPSSCVEDCWPESVSATTMPAWRVSPNNPNLRPTWR